MQVVQPTKAGTEAAKGAPVTVTLTLNERYDELCGTSGGMDRLREAIVRDLSTSLHADAARFEIVSIKPGSIIVTVVVRPDPQARDPRSSQQLAAQMTALANDPTSVMRSKPSLRAVSKVDIADGQAMAAGITGQRGSPMRDPSLAGIGLQFEVARNPRGVAVPVVTALVPDGPAAASGQVWVGDTVLECDGQLCEGKKVEALANMFLGLAGSVCRLKLLGAGPNGQQRTCSLVRRKVSAGGKEGNKLNDAASIIADSFKSPAYRKAPTNNTPSNFTGTPGAALLAFCALCILSS